ncbi:MAG: tetratricopeptide repeat protein [Candidatus Latescibacteria bacterium]|nr:tetratricopeptide repeat protein [Candidatus Latescibacterota bacterium]
MSSRLEQLEALAGLDPKDTFVQYAIALEYASAGRFQDAAATLERLVTLDPAYSAAYHQAGRAYEQLNQIEDAKRMYQQGIAVAARRGDLHAQKEMQEALLLLE